MKGNFGKTNFGGIIMHGMNNFGLISRMITDWAYPAGAIHRRLETRWVKPVRPGDTIQPTGIVKSKQATENSRWVLIDVMVREPGRREGRDRRGHGRIPARPDFASDFKRSATGIGSALGPNGAEWAENGPIRIDIRACDGLETAPSRAVGRWRDKSHFATFG